MLLFFFVELYCGLYVFFFTKLCVWEISFWKQYSEWANHNTGWNDKIVALEKTTWFHFCLMKTSFFLFFFVADHLLVGQLCINPKSDRSLLSCLKVTQCTMSKIRDVQLYNSYSLPIQVMTTGSLPAPSKCKSGLPWITETCQGWWKQSFRLRLWSSVWFQVRATSCHLRSSKLAWKSTPKCTWMCWRVWWSPGAIRWSVAESGYGSRTRCRPTSPKRPRLSFRRSAMTLYPSLTGPPLLPRPEPAGQLCLVILQEHHQHDLPQHLSQPDRHHPPSIHQALTDACGKGMLPVPDPYRGGGWSWRRLHVSSTR